MSRIIAGDAGSIRLKPAAASTRPTSDRVKESLFGQLENLGQLDGASVLDLFAGTGALGLEALSRGANHAVLVERDRKAHEISLENSKSVISAIQKSRSDASVENKKADADKFLKTNKQSFDLVFLDPPYDLPNQELLGYIEQLSQAVSDQGLFVIERSSRTESIQVPVWLREVSTRNYGDTQVTILQKLR